MKLLHESTRFARELWHWLGGRLKYIWLAVALLLAAALIAFAPPPDEQRIRVVGWLMELCGLLTVAWDIARTREHFRLPGVVEAAAAWWVRRPRFTVQTTSVSADLRGSFAVASAGGLSAEIGVSVPTIEQRLAALEGEFVGIKSRVGGVEDELRREVQARMAQIAHESATRNREVERIEAAMSEAHTGGLYLSGVGLAWLAVGLTLSTVPGEILCLLR